jgi:phosphoenolpyruvate synthase/pyruvate phosphate dikinase
MPHGTGSFGEDRTDFIRGMLLGTATEEHIKAFDYLKSLQRGDFEGLFREMKGLPLTIRRLDPQLHSFCRTRMILWELHQKGNIPVEHTETPVQLAKHPVTAGRIP